MSFFAALIKSLPQNFVACFRPVALLLLVLYALFIAVGVSVSIHWLSDAVTGVIVGTLIGMTVACDFKKAIIDL